MTASLMLFWLMISGDFGIFLVELGVGIKCAFPLLHNWLPDAYPEATPTGTVFLSALTTKVAVYALARGFAGTELLIYSPRSEIRKTPAFRRWTGRLG